MLLGTISIIPSALSETDSFDPDSVLTRVERLLQEGDFDNATTLLQETLRYDSFNSDISKLREQVHDMVQGREKLENEENAVRWNIIAERLRSFYQKHGMKEENIKINLIIYRKNKSTHQVVRVVDAYLDARQFQEAIDFLQEVDPSGKNPIVQIDRGWVHLFSGQKNTARSIARSVPPHRLDLSNDLLRLARLQAATELHASAVKTLILCFERTPPGLLQKVKEESKKLPEFEPLLTSSEFSHAMTTRSKIPSNDQSCARKWIGVTIDERPGYMRKPWSKDIRFEDWQVNPNR